MPPSDHASNRQSSQLHRSYDPYEDAQVRYPDWRIEVMDRAPDVGFFLEAKMVLISRRVFLANPRLAFAFVVAVLDDQDGLGRPCLTVEQEARADQVARERLGWE
jgi:hypothetical protein